MEFPGDILPLLGIREVWVVGLVLVVSVLRPVGRLGWAAAATVGVAGAAIVVGAQTAGADIGSTGALSHEPTLAWSLATGAWVVLALLLLTTALYRPLRWEPRTGPSAATALTFGAVVLHAGAAWHLGGRTGEIASRWAAGSLAPSNLTTHLDGLGTGPLTWAVTWLPGSLPGVGPRVGAAALSVGAVIVVTLGAERLGRRWGHVGTARCIAAAVAWSPPLLLAHAAAPAALLATAALVWSWWALVEIWAGRYRPGRLAFASGLLLGVAGGLAVWPLIATPLWLRRLGRRTIGWFSAGVGIVAVATVLVLVPTQVGAGDAWMAAVLQPLAQGAGPGLAVWPVALVALGALVVPQPLSPTRLSAATAAVLLLTSPWWPVGVAVAGPVTAMPFVLLASVAPDRPDERWPPDARVAA